MFVARVFCLKSFHFFSMQDDYEVIWSEFGSFLKNKLDNAKSSKFKLGGTQQITCEPFFSPLYKLLYEKTFSPNLDQFNTSFELSGKHIENFNSLLGRGSYKDNAPSWCYIRPNVNDDWAVVCIRVKFNKESEKLVISFLSEARHVLSGQLLSCDKVSKYK